MVFKFTWTHVPVVSTDLGSNMIIALKDTGRITCIAHITNTVLQNSFDKKKKKNCPANINRVLNTVKSLVMLKEPKKKKAAANTFIKTEL